MCERERKRWTQRACMQNLVNINLVIYLCSDIFQILHLISQLLYLNLGNISMPSQSENTYSVLRTPAISLSDANTYYCGGSYGNEQVFRESVNVTVRGNLACTLTVNFFLRKLCNSVYLFAYW